MFPIDRVVRIVPEGATFSFEDGHTIVEIGFLSVAADRTVHPDEEAALRAVAHRLLRGASDKGVDELFATIGTSLTRDEADARLVAAARRLTNVSTRELAYKLAYALGMVDLAAADEEFEFDLQLIDALELKNDEAERLSAEVVEALQG